MNILEVNNVSVRYRTGDCQSIGLKEYMIRRARNDYHVSDFWANRDITFSLEKGDMLGIIGTNGAGKSTLLKAISGIMAPTEGSIQRSGNIAALLELASGFDPNMTVRENAYLRGAMLGYTRKFMDEMYAQIIAFAELQEFEDRPFKHLSSGMKSRLAFSIASLVDPDILILDEVLAVGDGAFRQKSEAKMKEIIAGGATTILVSHSIAQVRKLCNKVLWLHKGEQLAFGSNVQDICDRYQDFLFGRPAAEQMNEIQRMRDQNTAAVMRKTGWTYKETVAHIEEARSRLGVTYLIYNANNFSAIPVEKQATHFRQLLDRIAQNRENCIAVTVKNTGWTPEYARDQIAEARRNLDIAYIDYTQHKLYSVPPDEQEDLYCSVLRNRR